MEVPTSDHLPLFLQLNKWIYMPRKQRFRFENTWLRENECKNVVSNGCDSVDRIDINEKIRACAHRLK